MNKSFTISINPWYFCNFRCDFCYLTPDQLGDKQLLDLTILRQRLEQLTSVVEVTNVDLYGGEIGILPHQYVQDLKVLLHEFNIHNINVITNLSMMNDNVLDPDFSIGVSYDFDCREKHDQVFANMLMFPRPFSILMLASPCLLQGDVDYMINSLNLLKNLECVDIKPYSSNQANQLGVTHTQHEEFVKKWISSTVPKKFTFVNEQLIQMSSFKMKNSFSDDHIYITPTGRFAALEFDLNDNEFFLEMDTVEQYFDWAEREKARVGTNKFCSACKYFGNCMSEHLKDIRSLDNGCNGYKHLLDWYATDVMGANEWKVRQALYHHIQTDYTDDMSKFNIEISDDILTNALRYFNDDTIGFVYPAKSYVVAICYARWLNEMYGIDVYQLMDDPDLLFGNDPYFIPYSQAKSTYDAIIDVVTLKFDETIGVIPDVKMYFDAEMLLKPEE